MRVREALRLCPHLVQRPTRPRVYAKVSRNIMHSLTTVCPDIEVFSVDEAFIDVTSCQKLYGSPEQAARELKQAVYQASGLLCSLGLSGDKTTAKYAAKLNKPDGFTVIQPWQAKSALQHVPVTELCGIAKGIGNFLDSPNRRVRLSSFYLTQIVFGQSCFLRHFVQRYPFCLPDSFDFFKKLKTFSPQRQSLVGFHKYLIT